MSALKTHVLVPYPGELMSPATGSAIVTVARSTGAAHIAMGASATCVARAGMDHDPRHPGLIEAPLPDGVWRTRAETAVDLLCGWLADCWRLRRLLTDDDERTARAAAARTRAKEISWNRQLALPAEWLARWEAA